MICAGCKRKLEVGDRYIEDTASRFLGVEADPRIDGLIADIFGGASALSGGAGGRVIYCEDCTVSDPTSHYRFSTYYGDEDESDECPGPGR